jgi:hypothetical protein
MKSLKGFLLSIALLVSHTPSAWAAKNSYIFDMKMMVEQARFAQNSTSGSNFSLVSATSPKGIMSFETTLYKRWKLFLGGKYTAHTYKIATSRTLENPQINETIGMLGFNWRFGNFVFYTHAHSQPFFVISDITATDHEIKSTNITMGKMGFEIRGTSEYWDIALGLMAGAPTAVGQIDSADVTVQYTLTAKSLVTFGRKNKTLFEAISSQNLSKSEFLYGLSVELNDAKYTWGDTSYTRTDVAAGLVFTALF